MRGARRRTGLLAVALAGALVVAACGGDDDEGTTGSTAAPGTSATATSTGSSGGDTTVGCATEHQGGTMTMGVQSPPSGIDPVKLFGDGSVGATEVTAMYDTLMQFNNETKQYDPRVAESMEPNADYTEWTMKLRPGTKFGNGTPLTTAKVKSSIQRFSDPANASTYASFVASITDMEIKDDLTMVFHLDDSWPGFLFLLADAPGMIVDTAVVTQRGKDFGTNPLGAGVGPFEFDHWSPGEEMVFKKKADYWGGPVCLDELRFVPMVDGPTAYDTFKAGETDLGITSDSKVGQQIAKEQKHFVETVQNAAFAFLVNNGTNGSKPPTADVRVRKAVQQAIDPVALNDRVRDGSGLPTTALIAPGSRFYQGLKGLPYDQAAAKALVTEAKADGWDGSIELLCNASGEDSAIAAKAALDAVGMKTTTEATLSIPDMLARVYGTGDYQLNCWGLSMSDDNVYSTLFQNFYSKSAGNNMGYANADMDAAILELRHAVTIDDQKKALAKIQDVFNETVPMVLLLGYKPIIFWSNDVQGLQFNHRLGIYFDEAWMGK